MPSVLLLFPALGAAKKNMLSPQTTAAPFGCGWRGLQCRICSACGHMVNKDLSQRTHRCDKCGLVIDRDINASRNILSLGTKLYNDKLLDATIL